MRIALWTYDALDDFAEGLKADARADLHVDRCSQRHCTKLLEDDRTDVALVPSIDILRDPESFQVVPKLGLASLGGFPNVRLRLHSPLNRIGTIGMDHTGAQAAELASLLVREHYGQPGRLISRTDGSTSDEPFDAVVECEDHPEHIVDISQVLDMGTEWYELTTRPMVWGLLVSRQSQMPAGLYELLIGASSSATWIVLDDVRGVREGRGETFTQLDEFALQGLEKFTQYLFWTNRIDQIPDLRFARIPELKVE